YRPSLVRKIHGCADNDHGFNSVRLQRGHVEKDVSSHAQSDGTAFFYAKPIKKAQCIQRALAMCNGLLRIVGSTMTACVRLDERVFAHEEVSTCIDPVLQATSAAVKEQKRISLALGLVIHIDVVELNSSGLHAAIMAGPTGTNNLGNLHDKI